MDKAIETILRNLLFQWLLRILPGLAPAKFRGRDSRVLVKVAAEVELVCVSDLFCDFLHGITALYETPFRLIDPAQAQPFQRR